MVPQGDYLLSYQAPSTSLLFYPRTQSIHVVANRCQDSIPVVHTREGRVISGQVIPPLPQVLIRMTVEEEGVKSVLETYSNENGWYAFTAIDNTAVFISFDFSFILFILFLMLFYIMT